MSPINLDRIQSWIDQGRLDPSQPITMKELHKSRCLHGVKRHGVKLLARVRRPSHSLSRAFPSSRPAAQGVRPDILIFHTKKWGPQEERRASTCHARTPNPSATHPQTPTPNAPAPAPRAPNALYSSLMCAPIGDLLVPGNLTSFRANSVPD